MNNYSYKKLDVWRKSIVLTKQLYLTTNNLPKSEEYNLKSQMRRAAISVSSNIAEGSARSTSPDQKKFYTIARSSLIELDSQLETALALDFLGQNECDAISATSVDIYKMLSKLLSRS